ncbi:DUF4369 domain-containing protein [Dyadobacter sediminis]|uniref:DUF4369 domain-containing protein n=1 Tax=Dyadobacter sediminis TaxID=1493691 RepID=A0A5R9KIG7_9BACT|nr:DUF4369 domain-containing protein [Dyadobacter sediminis]TLU95995.1 hypothetical protein FEM55_02265 [Dyadobacter sediminis]GGB78370.1 hypothetical protein GCM10011325_02350 [Dyadobacter sediminis]
MIKNLKIIFVFLLIFPPAFAQHVRIKIDGATVMKGRKAIILTREKGFAAVVHSIKLSADSINLQMDPNLLPDLYQLQVSGMKGSLSFFFESGMRILLDTNDISRSVTSGSESNMEWEYFHKNILLPSEQKVNDFVKMESLARKSNLPDSINYWRNLQEIEKENLNIKTLLFIQEHPRSYVSLYLLKTNWYALRNNEVFGKLDSSLFHHRTYRYLKQRNKAFAGSK